MVRKKLKKINHWIHLLWIPFFLIQCSSDSDKNTYTASKSHFQLYPIDSLDWDNMIFMDEQSIDTNHFVDRNLMNDSVYYSLDSSLQLRHLQAYNNHQFSIYQNDSLFAFYLISSNNKLIFTYFSNADEPDDFTYYTNGIATGFKIGDESLELLNIYDAKTFTKADYHNFNKFGIYSIDSVLNHK